MAVVQTGPLTVDPNDLALGLAQIRVCAYNASSGGASILGSTVASIESASTYGTSMGSLATTRLTIERSYFTHEAGFPLLQDAQIPIRESAQLECTFEEVSGRNLALSAGKNPWSSGSGEVALGALALPAYVRMEAWYSFPNITDKMYIIFPRAQVLSNTEIEFQKEENAKIPVTFKAQRADSGLSSGGNAVWDNMPLGRIYFE